MPEVVFELVALEDGHRLHIEAAVVGLLATGDMVPDGPVLVLANVTVPFAKEVGLAGPVSEDVPFNSVLVLGQKVDVLFDRRLLLGIARER